ncbi:hypothetical protein H4F99_01730 [Lysobacter sp. SG-8]|uniref:VCBS repeat-containing protein n=1 Tax=Marilutibacter penaei TaxID=2759900 RepID=A0A7W3U1I7_9GAMM|nr:hypothetical protein [Lysobacter penaei]MBB1087202.1 hypothetical protein [Lysobacter penaei]
MRLLASSLLVIGGLALAACSEPATPDTTPAPAAAPSDALETPPPIDASPTAETPAEAPVAYGDEAGAQAAVAAYLEQEGAEADTRHRDARVDLDGDGQDDLLVYLEDPYFCGSGGCSLVVFRNEGATFTKVASTSVTRSPIAVGAAGPAGWRELYVSIGGGGGASGVVRLVHEGGGYPGNPSTLPVVDSMPDDARIVID